MTSQRSTINPVLEPLVAVHREIYPKADLAILQRAYEVAEEKHSSQMRRPAIRTSPIRWPWPTSRPSSAWTPPLWSPHCSTTPSKTPVTNWRPLTADFGEEVAHLVDGVTKLDKVVLGTAAEGETIRKMIIAMARDPRVLVIKVADRLHNMRTMRFLPPEKQARKARETLEVIAPLPIGSGWRRSSGELEDLSFAILHPKRYEEIVRLVADRRRRVTPIWRRFAPRSPPR